MRTLPALVDLLHTNNYNIQWDGRQVQRAIMLCGGMKKRMAITDGERCMAITDVIFIVLVGTSSCCAAFALPPALALRLIFKVCVSPRSPHASETAAKERLPVCRSYQAAADE